MADETQERTEGPTPHGGAYAVAYFLDESRRPCRKDRARWIEIHECDASGASIFRTWLER